MSDVEQVGGKNASLGEMISQLAAAGVRVPGGFATTAAAFRDFLEVDGLAGRIEREMEGLDVDDVVKLAATGKRIRGWIAGAELPQRLKEALAGAYAKLSDGEPAAVAVRSSATAEDLPDASFAGQQETFLNIRGLDHVIDAVRHTFASLYNDRAIAYRVHKGFVHANVALSCGIQRMVRSDLRRERRDVHHRHRIRIRRRRVHHRGLRARRDGGAGRGEPRRVLRLEDRARSRAARDPPSQPRGQGDQDGLHRPRTGRPFGGDRARAGTGPAALRHQRRRDRGTRALRRHHREALRASHGHRMGPRWRRRQALHPPGAARRR